VPYLNTLDINITIIRCCTISCLNHNPCRVYPTSTCMPIMCHVYAR